MRVINSTARLERGETGGEAGGKGSLSFPFPPAPLHMFAPGFGFFAGLFRAPSRLSRKGLLAVYPDLHCNKPWYNEIHEITVRIQNAKCKICLDMMNKCHHTTEVECKTDQWRCVETLYLEFYLIFQIWLVNYTIKPKAKWCNITIVINQSQQNKDCGCFPTILL